MLQVVRFSVVMHLRKVSSDWLVCLVCPLDYREKPEVRLTVAPKAVQNTFQTAEVNCQPRSETMSAGMSCSRKTWLTMMSMVSLANGSLGRAMKWAALEKWSTMVKCEDGCAVQEIEGGVDQRICVFDCNVVEAAEVYALAEGSILFPPTKKNTAPTGDKDGWIIPAAKDSRI